MPSSSLSTPRERDSHVLSLREIPVVREWTFRSREFRFHERTISFLSCSFITLSNSQNSEEVWYLYLEENANAQVWSLLVFETYFESRPIFLAFLRLTKRGRGVFVAPDSVVFARIFPVWLRNAGYDEFVTLPYNFRHSYNRTSTYARPHLIEGLNFRVKRSHPISQLSPLVAFTFNTYIYVYARRQSGERKGEDDREWKVAFDVVFELSSFVFLSLFEFPLFLSYGTTFTKFHIPFEAKIFSRF